MDRVEKLIDEHPLEVRCHHCEAINTQTLGWIRSRREMSCDGCEDLILLDTSDIRSLLRDTERQLRSLNHSLGGQVHARGKGPGEPVAASRPSGAAKVSDQLHDEKAQVLLRIFAAVEELLGIASRTADLHDRRLYVKSGIRFHEPLRALCDSIEREHATPEVHSAIAQLERRLDAVCHEVGLVFDGKPRKR